MKQTKTQAVMNGLTSVRPGQETGETPKAAAHGLQLSPVRTVETGRLKDNPFSAKHFRSLSDADFEKLKGDIASRGILVPLVAMKDGTLLAGHNRLRAARELALLSVQVQWVEDNLSEKDKQAFVIKDNVLRRQLSAQEKETLIVTLYGKQILESKHGGDRKAIKVKSNLAQQIEAETGIKAPTVKQIAAKHKKASKPKPAPVIDPKVSLKMEIARFKADVIRHKAGLKEAEKGLAKAQKKLASLKRE